MSEYLEFILLCILYISFFIDVFHVRGASSAEAQIAKNDDKIALHEAKIAKHELKILVIEAHKDFDLMSDKCIGLIKTESEAISDLRRAIDSLMQTNIALMQAMQPQVQGKVNCSSALISNPTQWCCFITCLCLFVHSLFRRYCLHY